MNDVNKKALKFDFRRLRPHWKKLPHQQKAVILTALLGATALALTLYTMAHTETVPITGRKRFIFITHDQMIKIVEKEVEEVSIIVSNFRTVYHL